MQVTASDSLITPAFRVIIMRSFIKSEKVFKVSKHPMSFVMFRAYLLIVNTTHYKKTVRISQKPLAIDIKYKKTYSRGHFLEKSVINLFVSRSNLWTHILEKTTN